MQAPQLTLPARRVKRAVMQISVALARTEEAPIGGRAPTKEGRARARQLADAALVLSPDSADAHAAMGVSYRCARTRDGRRRTAPRGQSELVL
jgi:hypothetical protein